MNPVSLSGTWRVKRGEGVQEFMKSMGVPEEHIPADSKAGFSSDITIVQDGDQFVIKPADAKESAPDAQHETRFVVGQEFSCKGMEGEDRTIASWEDQKLVLKPIKGNGYSEYEMVDGELVLTCWYEKACAKTFFAKA